MQMFEFEVARALAELRSEVETMRAERDKLIEMMLRADKRLDELESKLALIVL